MNKSILLGRLTKDIETRYTQATNSLVASFTLAVNRKFAKPGEERQTDFINIVAFGKTGEFCSKYFKKGQQVVIVGRLQVRNYEDNNNQKRYITEVIAEECYFAESSNRKNIDTSILNSPSPTPSPETTLEISEDDDLPF